MLVAFVLATLGGRSLFGVLAGTLLSGAAAAGLVLLHLDRSPGWVARACGMLNLLVLLFACVLAAGYQSAAEAGPVIDLAIP